MRVEVEIKRDGPGFVQAWAEAVFEDDPTKALMAVAEVVKEQAERSINTRTDPWGEAWVEATEATKEIERARRGQTLSLGKTYVRRAAGMVYVGIRRRFARSFHYGAPQNRIFGGPVKPIPARPIFPLRRGGFDLPPELLSMIKRRFFEAMREALRGRT